MEAIRKAVKKSPRPFRRQGCSTKTASSSKHKKFSDHWGEEKEPVKEGVTFYLKYIGSTLVEELTEEGASYGDKISSRAVATIVSMAKLSGKKLPKMSVTVSKRGIKVVCMATNDVQADITIYRINFCTSDKTHDKVFAYIARNMENETMECSAFLCPKRKIAQAVTLTVAEAFRVAQEEWEETELNEQHKKQMRALSTQSSPEGSSSRSSAGDPGQNGQSSSGRSTPQDVFSLGIGSTGCQSHPSPAHRDRPVVTSSPQIQLGFEDNFVEEDEFSSFAQSRSGRSEKGTHLQSNNETVTRNPFLGRQLVTGLTAEDLDEGVEHLVNGQPHPENLTRQLSVDDLLLL